jgi:hypothetical protein
MILSMLFIIQIQTNSNPLQQLTFLRQTAHFSELLRPTYVFKLMYAEDNEKIVSESDFGLLIFFINFLKKTQTSN